MLDQVTRRNFFRATALAAAAVSVGVRAEPPVIQTKVRICPIEGRRYSTGFLAFCANARFDSARHALQSVCDREEEFALEFIQEAAG